MATVTVCDALTVPVLEALKLNDPGETVRKVLTEAGAAMLRNSGLEAAP